MAEVKISGIRRTEFGKGASRRARRDGQVPAVIYGHGSAPAHITLPVRELTIALKTPNVLLDITYDGKNELTLPKAIVRDALKSTLEHVDLVFVNRNEAVVVAVPVHTEGKYDQDGILEHVHTTVEVKAPVTAIPQFLVLDLTGLVAGQSKYAADVVLPAGVTLESDPKMIVAHLSERSTHVEETPVAAPAAEAAAAPAADAEKKES